MATSAGTSLPTSGLGPEQLPSSSSSDRATPLENLISRRAGEVAERGTYPRPVVTGCQAGSICTWSALVLASNCSARQRLGAHRRL